MPICWSLRAKKSFLILISTFAIFTLLANSNLLASDKSSSFFPFSFNRTPRINICLHDITDKIDIIPFITPLSSNQNLVPLRCNGKNDVLITDSQSLPATSLYANKIYVYGSYSGPAIDQFIQKDSRWMVDPRGGNGYEVLFSTTDPDRLAVHKELDYLQHRCTNFFLQARFVNGFGSNWHVLGLDLAYTLYYNMTLFPPIQSRNLLPITSCTIKQLKASFSANPPERDYKKWDHTTLNYESPDDDLWNLMSRRDIIKSEFQERGHLWWRSMLTYYVVRPTYKVREGIRRNLLSKPCTSIHVRHSDKHIESTLLDFAEYMVKAEGIRQRTGINNIYLMTDDPSVIESTKSAEYNKFNFSYLSMKRTNAGWYADFQKGASMDSQEEKFLLDVYTAATCDYKIVTYSSNVGRLIAELSYAIHDKEPDVISMDEEWKMEP